MIFWLLQKFQRLKSFVFTNQKLYSLSTAACVADSDRQKCGNRATNEPRDEIIFRVELCPTMVTLNISSALSYFNSPPTVINFTSANSPEVLDLSYGVLAHCMTTLVGLSGLETLELSGNYCTDISDDLLDHLPSLRYLGLAAVHLNSTYVRTRVQRLLAHLPQLRTLDLSRNGLIELQGRSLPAQTSLQHLLLAHNHFQSLPLRDLHLHSDLIVLDLSFNDITFLTVDERKALDQLASNGSFRYSTLLKYCLTSLVSNQQGLYLLRSPFGVG